MLRKSLCLAVALIAVSATSAYADADLRLTATQSSNVVNVGDENSYTATLNNDGPATAPNVHVKVDFSSNVQVTSAPSFCTINGTSVDCAPGTLPAPSGGSGTITARATSGRVIQVTATASSDEPDPNPQNNSASLTTALNGSSSNSTTPPPQAGKTETAEVVRGTPRVKLRGSNTFVPVTSAQSIPDGSEVDTSHGTMRITVGVPGGGTESAELSEGRVVVHQDLSRTPAVTTLTLSEPLTGCPAAARAAKKKQGPPGPKSRRIVISTKGGHFESVGRYATAIAAGTAWRTTDTCVATVVQALEGTVRVTDVRRRLSAPLAAPAKRTIKRKKR